MDTPVQQLSRYTVQQLAAIRSEYAAGATDAQFANFMRECESRNLEPGRHVYFQLRLNSVLDHDTGTWIKQKRPIHLTSIDAFRLIAQRTREYRGQEAPMYIYLDDANRPTIRSDVPLCGDGGSQQSDGGKSAPLMPWAAEVSVYRKDFEKAVSVVARFEAYAVRKRDGSLSDMWNHRGPEQLAKCAEALALRKAFPEELGSIYIEEELPDTPERDSDSSAPYQATDANVPALIGTPEKQAVIVGHKNPVTVEQFAQTLDAKVVSTKPSTKDRAAFVKRAREYGRKILPAAGLADSEQALKAYVLGKAGVSDANEISKESWESILATLDKLLVSGGEAAVAKEVRSAA